jgi:hypothetical protein
MINHWKTYASITLIAGLFSVTISSAQAEGDVLLSRMQPDDVFEINLLWNNGSNYWQFTYMADQQSVCALDAEGTIVGCPVDLAATARLFQQVTVVEAIPALPPSIQWSGEHATPVDLVATFKLWNAESQRASQWKLACSVIPDHTALAVCVQVDRLDHFNYLTIQAEALDALITTLGL